MMTTRNAACSCGQLQATTSGDPVRISVCHCLACQRRTGSVFGMQARFPRAQVQIRGESRVYTRISDDGNAVDFHFCAQCGATVFYHGQEDDPHIAIPVGAFADPAFPPPAFSVYEERKHRWVTIPGDVEHHS
ncbi:GFA family protein [Undibacterium luofuense]|nr:GFA family protein [Undibacterium luofuense]